MNAPAVPKPVVLALDLASSSGFAIGPVGGRPRFGSIDLGDRDSTPAEKGAALLRFLSDLLKVETPALVVIEEPLNVKVLEKIGATFRTVLILYGLAFLALVICRMRDVHNVRFASTQDVRGHFMGVRTFKGSYDPVKKRKISSRENAKRAVINTCRLRGWDVADDDAADAAAAWDWGCAQVDPRTAMLATPLFGKMSS